MTRPLFALSALLILGQPLAAQVGYSPSASPFGDIGPGTTVELYGGQMFGSGGPIPLGPKNGPVAGVRLMLRAKNTISIGFGAWGALTERLVIDANAPVATRISGPIDHRLLAGEATVQFNVTGGKHWHGLAPFAGVGLGFANGQATPASDTSGYSFGTKFYFAPMLGTRIMLGSRAYLRLEGRIAFWNLKYPATYSLEPSLDPGTEENPNAVNPGGRPGQYVSAPQLLVGFGWGL